MYAVVDLQGHELMMLLDQLPGLPGVTDWLDVRQQVGTPPEDGYGLYGSGVFVINPPYTLAAELQEAMPTNIFRNKYIRNSKSTR